MNRVAGILVIASFWVTLIAFFVITMGCGHQHPVDPKLHEKHVWKFECGNGISVRLQLSQYDVTYRTSEVYDEVEQACLKGAKK